MGDTAQDPSDLDKRLASFNQPSANPDCLYHAITLTADDNFKVVFGTQSEWVGWTDDSMRHELRQSRVVYADFVKIWQKIGQPYSFIHTVDELMVFLGGVDKFDPVTG